MISRLWFWDDFDNKTILRQFQFQDNVCGHLFSTIKNRHAYCRFWCRSWFFWICQPIRSQKKSTSASKSTISMSIVYCRKQMTVPNVTWMNEWCLSSLWSVSFNISNRNKIATRDSLAKCLEYGKAWRCLLIVLLSSKNSKKSVASCGAHLH